MPPTKSPYFLPQKEINIFPTHISSTLQDLTIPDENYLNILLGKTKKIAFITKQLTDGTITWVECKFDEPKKREKHLVDVIKGGLQFNEAKYLEKRKGWFSVELKLKKNVRVKKNIDDRTGFRLDDIYLVKTFFTFGLTSVLRQTCHVIQTTYVPIKLYILKRGEGEGEGEAGSMKQRTLRAEFQYHFGFQLIPPHSIIKIESGIKYVIVTVQKTMFSFQIMNAAIQIKDAICIHSDTPVPEAEEEDMSQEDMSQENNSPMSGGGGGGGGGVVVLQENRSSFNELSMPIIPQEDGPLNNFTPSITLPQEDGLLIKFTPSITLPQEDGPLIKFTPSMTLPQEEEEEDTLLKGPSTTLPQEEGNVDPLNRPPMSLLLQEECPPSEWTQFIHSSYPCFLKDYFHPIYSKPPPILSEEDRSKCNLSGEEPLDLTILNDTNIGDYIEAFITNLPKDLPEFNLNEFWEEKI